MRYGWIITKDHLAEQFSDMESEVGTMGPSGIPDDVKADLLAGKGHTFRMYDDDGELYYTGKGILPPDDEECDWEIPLVAPLANFGTPNAGAVLIKWHGRPEWTCEY